FVRRKINRTSCCFFNEVTDLMRFERHVSPTDRSSSGNVFGRQRSSVHVGEKAARFIGGRSRWIVARERSRRLFWRRIHICGSPFPRFRFVGRGWAEPL